MSYLARCSRLLFRKVEVNPCRYRSVYNAKQCRSFCSSFVKMKSAASDEKPKTASFVIENNILKGALQPVDDEQKLGQFILDTLSENPDHVSQIDAETGEQTTHGEMKDRSIRCALWLQKLGLGPRDIVVVCTHNRLDTYVPVFATFYVDAIFSAWNYNMTIHTARRYMKQFTPKVVFTCEQAADVLVEAAKLEDLAVEFVVFGKHSSLPTLTKITSEQTQKQIDSFTVVNEKSPRDASLVLLSSGSTGFPKGVMSSSKAVLANLLKQKATPNVTPKIMWYSTLDWYSCITFVLHTVYTKQTRIIPGSSEVESVCQTVEKYKVNRIFLPPVLVTSIAKSRLAHKYDLKSLGVVFIGGSPCSKEVVQGLKQHIPDAFIYHVYGTTETGVLAASTPASKHIQSVGFVSSNYLVKFVDLVSGKSLGPNQQGEVYVKSPAIMIGYYNNPKETTEAFDEEGWFRTGDIGYYDETGEIFVVDRIKEMIEVGSHRISPAEIEEILLLHPGVQEAIVVGLPHEYGTTLPVALCKKAPESKVTEDELMELTSKLEDYKKLSGGIHFIDNFIYTSSGKIARNEMKKIAETLLKKKNES